MDEINTLKKYKELLDDGTITEEEFESIKDGIMFGNPVVEEKPLKPEPMMSNVKPNHSDTVKPKDNKLIIIVIEIVVAVIGLGIGGYFLYANSQSKTVDLKEMMTEDVVYGYNDFGMFEDEVMLDGDKVDAFILKISNADKKAVARNVLENLYLNFKPYEDDYDYEHISNGDTFTVTAEYDKGLAESIDLKFKNTRFVYTVEGLEVTDDVVYKVGEYNDYPEDFLLPDSNTRLYTEEELYYEFDMDSDLYQTAINELYARHGYIFGDKTVSSEFSKYSWYTSYYSSNDFKESWFNSYENHNLKLLTKLRADAKDYEKFMEEWDDCWDYCDNCGDEVNSEEWYEVNGHCYCYRCYNLLFN